MRYFFIQENFETNKSNLIVLPSEKKINEKKNFFLDNSDINHMKNVLRMETGDRFLGIVPNHKKYEFEIVQWQKNTLTVYLLSSENIDQHTNVFQIHLYQSVLKEKRMSIALEKATELGIEKIVPVITERIVVRLRSKDHNNKLERWRKIITTSAKQARLTFLPQVSDMVYLKNIFECHKINWTMSENEIIMKKLCQKVINLVLWENEKKIKLKNILSKYQADTDNKPLIFRILTGPEGGFSEQEIQKLLKGGWQTVSIKQNIVRAETASIIAISNIQYNYTH